MKTALIVVLLTQFLVLKPNAPIQDFRKPVEIVQYPEIKPLEPLTVDFKPIPVKPVSVTGNKETWLRASGIAVEDWVYVDYIIQKESGWNPNARNKSSGAGGLPQALPYSKTGCVWGDPICQLKWADQYAKNRYNSWYQAYTFWQSHSWW